MTTTTDHRPAGRITRWSTPDERLTDLTGHAPDGSTMPEGETVRVLVDLGAPPELVADALHRIADWYARDGRATCEQRHGPQTAEEWLTNLYGADPVTPHEEHVVRCAERGCFQGLRVHAMPEDHAGWYCPVHAVDAAGIPRRGGAT